MERVDYVAAMEKILRQYGTRAEAAPEPSREDDLRADLEKRCGLEAKELQAVLGPHHQPDTHPMRVVRHHLRIAPNTALCLTGPHLVGKTVAAAAWLLDLLGRAQKAQGWKVTSGWIDALALTSLPSAKPDEVHRLSRLPALVLDDLGAEAWSFSERREAFLATLAAILGFRARKGLPTCITTNMDSARFAKSYGDRIMAHLERSDAAFVACDKGPIRRRR